MMNLGNIIGSHDINLVKNQVDENNEFHVVGHLGALIGTR